MYVKVILKRDTLKERLSFQNDGGGDDVFVVVLNLFNEECRELYFLLALL